MDGGKVMNINLLVITVGNTFYANLQEVERNITNF